MSLRTGTCLAIVLLLRSWDANPVQAQGIAIEYETNAHVHSQIAVIDLESLFELSDEGRSVLEELDETAQIHGAENRELRADLEQEERSLADRRKTISTEEFARLSEEFDSRVRSIRQAQAEKFEELRRDRDFAKSEFLKKALPEIRAYMRERDIKVAVDRNDVDIIAIAEGVDITGAILARLNRIYNLGISNPNSPE